MRRRLAIALAVAAVGSLAAVGFLTRPSPGPQVTAPAPGGCLPDPSAQIAALPAGATFTGTGVCFKVPNGLTLNKPVTLNGGTYEDDSTGPTKVPGQYLGVHPVISVKGADVTLENLSITGGQVGGPRYVAREVTQAGIYTKSSVRTTIRSVTVDRVFGDCLTIYQNGPRSGSTSYLNVDHFRCISSGRFGISPSAVYEATLNDVTIDPKPNGAAIDFESDNPGVGASFVTFNRLTASNGIYVREHLGGPVTFNNATLAGAVTLQNLNSATVFPVTFNGGSLAVGTGRTIGVQIKGGAAAFNLTTFTRQPTVSGKPQKGGLWWANTGARLAFNYCALSAPLGTNDSTSTVTVTP